MVKSRLRVGLSGVSRRRLGHATSTGAASTSLSSEGGASKPGADSTSGASAVPFGMRVAGAYAWRFLALAGVTAVVIWLIIQLKLIILPLIVAVLITALVWPAFSFLTRHHVPTWLACVISVVGTIAVVSGLIWLVAWQVGNEWESVSQKATDTYHSFLDFLRTGPLHLSDDQIQQYLGQGLDYLQKEAGALAHGVVTIGETIGHFGAGFILAIFIWLCLLADGEHVWKWTVRLFPKRAREATDVAGRNGWRTLVSYARTQIVVAIIDGAGIGIGTFLLGVPLAIPIGAMVFLGAFVPLVGAIVTGFIAVLIALLYNGIWIALALLAVVIFVQEFESHVLQPVIMGSAVNVHPLAVVLVVAGGSFVAGIPGALLAVPTAAFVNVTVNTIASGSWRNGPTDPHRHHRKHEHPKSAQ